MSLKFLMVVSPFLKIEIVVKSHLTPFLGVFVILVKNVYLSGETPFCGLYSPLESVLVMGGGGKCYFVQW
jgi:hypothetical protein